MLPDTLVIVAQGSTLSLAKFTSGDAKTPTVYGVIDDPRTSLMINHAKPAPNSKGGVVRHLFSMRYPIMETNPESELVPSSADATVNVTITYPNGKELAGTAATQALSHLAALLVDIDGTTDKVDSASAFAVNAMAGMY